MADPSVISVGALISRHRLRIAVTLALVLLEAVVDLLFPLFVGLAVNDLLDDERGGLVALGALGVAALAVGAGRRFYDTRTYSGIYAATATDVVGSEAERGADVSTTSARAGLLTEFVDFLEHSLPAVVVALIGLVGTLVILATLEFTVFLAALGLLALIVAVYAITGGFHYRLNTGLNDELERQVDVISRRDLAGIGGHFGAIARWKIRLSDLETWNFTAIWLGIIGLFVYAPIAVVDSGDTEYGFALSALLYVFTFVEGAVELPVYVQQLIRLKEISDRLSPD